MAETGRLFDSTGAVELRSLVSTLGDYGLRTRLHPAARIVDAVTYGPGQWCARERLVQRVVLRPHGTELWWWLYWPAEPTECGRRLPELTLLSPAVRVVQVARRIHRVLVLTED